MTSSLSSNIDGFDTDKSLDENLDKSDDCKDLLTGQINFFLLHELLFYIFMKVADVLEK